jgi:hypothetical protein
MGQMMKGEMAMKKLRPSYALDGFIGLSVGFFLGSLAGATCMAIMAVSKGDEE